MKRFEMREAWAFMVQLMRAQGLKATAICAALLLAGFAMKSPYTDIIAAILPPNSGPIMLDSPSQIGAVVIPVVFTPILLAMIVSAFVAWRMCLWGHDESALQSVMRGLVSSLPGTLATVVLMFLFAAVGFIFLLPFGGALANVLNGFADVQTYLPFVLALLVVFTAVPLFVAARLGIFGPYMTAYKSRNPVPALRESWEMTEGLTGSLMLYLFMVQIVLGGAYLVLRIVAGILGMYNVYAGIAVTYISTLALTVILSFVFAGVYLALAARSEWGEDDIEAVFD